MSLIVPFLYVHILIPFKLVARLEVFRHQANHSNEIAAYLFATTFVSEIVDSGGNKIRKGEREREDSS